MTYRLAYTQRAAKDISKLQRNVKERIKKTLLKYSENPLSYAKKMVDTTLGMYSHPLPSYF